MKFENRDYHKNQPVEQMNNQNYNKYWARDLSMKNNTFIAE